MIEGEDEEEAYQRIKDAFGIDVVKLSLNLRGMKFDTINLDEDKQIAELYYLYNNKTMAYFINAPYRESSWGTDVEDTVEKEYTKIIDDCPIAITIFKVDKNNDLRCQAKFTYNNIEYLLTGTMTEQNFEKILENLIFPN